MSNFNQRQNIYIHPQNQQLLWNTMNKTPMFSHMNPQIKDSWFKGIIQQFYNSNQHVYDAALLQQINKETIAYMVANLKGDSVRFTTNMTTVQGPPANTVYRGKEDERALKQEEFNKAFEERQNQYFLKKPPMPDIDFTEKLDDRPITNMEELIQMHQKEREYEINKYSPLQNILPGGNPTPAIPDILPSIPIITTPTNTSMVYNTQTHPVVWVSRTQPGTTFGGAEAKLPSELVVGLQRSPDHESLVNKLNILTDNYEKLKIMMEDMNSKYDYLVNEIGRFTEPQASGAKQKKYSNIEQPENITLEEDKDNTM